MRMFLSVLALGFLCERAAAEPPRVIADIAPVHSLVAQVMEGVATPDLLIPARTSPHGHALKPSEARRLAQADVVFWVGETLTPWLERALATLADDAVAKELLDVEGITLIHLNGEEEEHETGHDHSHDGIDPHIWLDYRNARILVKAIAETLAAHDAENADRYRQNAKAAARQIEKMGDEIAARMHPFKDTRYIVYHDGYRYFETRFRLGRAIAISDGHTTRPGARRTSEIRELLKETGARCVFVEPQFDPKAATSILRGSDAKPVTLDPLGDEIEPGPDLYETVLRNQAETMIECLK